MKAKTPTPTLDFPPFPKMKWNGFPWRFEMTFPTWKGRRIVGTGSDRTNGKATVNIEFPGQSPFSAQASAYEFIVRNEASLSTRLLTELFKRYKQDRVELHPKNDDDLRELMPRVKAKEGMLTVYSLSGVHILPTAKSKYAYVGFAFHCEYDIEHGVGIMTHKKRIIAVGGADHAFLQWIAEADL